MNKFNFVQSSLKPKASGLFLVLVTGLFLTAPAVAAEITDADSCAQAVQSSEAKILKTYMQADLFNKVVADADAAKAACSAGDFAKANELTKAIDAALAAVQK